MRHTRKPGKKPPIFALLFVGVAILTFIFSKDYLARQFVSIAQEEGAAVEQIHLEGRKYTDIAQIKEIIQIEKGDAILSIPIDHIREELEALPWVKQAVVEIKLPSDVYIKIQERTPVAFFQHNNQLSLIDREGNLLPSHSDFTALPILIGSAVPDRISKFWSVLEKQPDLLKEIASATIISSRRWNITLYNDIVIKLPEKKYEQAWEKFGAFYAKANVSNIASVDMRIEGKMYVKKKDKFGNTYR